MRGLSLQLSYVYRLVTGAWFMLALFPVMEFAESAYALDLILCESVKHDYRYCRARTENRVNLKRRLSDAPCIFNRTWGYDNRGVWVAEGCRAEFEVGRPRGRRDGGREWDQGWYPDSRYPDRDSRPSNDEGMSDGAVAAIALGALIGGALLGSVFSGDMSSAPPPPSNPQVTSPPAVYSPPPSNQPYQYEDYRYGNDYERGRVPSWLVGSYRGYSTIYPGQLELQVFPDGSLQMKSGGNTDKGYYRDGKIVLEGRNYQVSPDGRDIKAVDTGNPSNQLILGRIQ